MVKKDLERVGIPYVTKEGVADFHASGRHTYITGLLRNGASITEARELARHTDVKMTMKYTHIGLKDQARALASLPAPGRSSETSETAGQHIGRTFCDGTGADMSRPDTGSRTQQKKRPTELKTKQRLLARRDKKRRRVATIVTHPPTSGGGGNRTSGLLNATRLLINRLRKRRTACQEIVRISCAHIVTTWQLLTLGLRI